MRTATIRNDGYQSGMLRFVQRLAACFGLGVVNLEDPDYVEICELHRSLSGAYRRGDLATFLTALDRDHVMVRPDMNRVARGALEDQLQAQFSEQVRSDYREEPAHVVFRGRRAHVATRVFACTVLRRDGKHIEVRERSESLSIWAKSASGWKRVLTRVRFHEQDIEWIGEPAGAPAPSRLQKFTR